LFSVPVHVSSFTYIPFRTFTFSFVVHYLSWLFTAFPAFLRFDSTADFTFDYRRLISFILVLSTSPFPYVHDFTTYCSNSAEFLSLLSPAFCVPTFPSRHVRFLAISVFSLPLWNFVVLYTFPRSSRSSFIPVPSTFLSGGRSRSWSSLVMRSWSPSLGVLRFPRPHGPGRCSFMVIRCSLFFREFQFSVLRYYSMRFSFPSISTIHTFLRFVAMTSTRLFPISTVPVLVLDPLVDTVDSTFTFRCSRCICSCSFFSR